MTILSRAEVWEHKGIWAGGVIAAGAIGLTLGQGAVAGSLAPAVTAAAGAAWLGAAVSQRRQTRRLTAMKSNFVALANHELRTPVTALLGALESLDADAAEALTPAQRELLRAARDSSAGLAYTVEVLTQLEALTDPSASPPSDEAKLGTVTEQAVARLDRLYDQCGVQLAVSLDAAAAERVVPRWYCRIVLEQLLCNAARFGHAGGTSNLVGTATDSQVNVHVSNQGPAVPAEARELIFESFYQADTSLKRRVSGLGLGLTLARLAARHMGGDVVLSDTSESGSTFTLRLPAQDRSSDNRPLTE